MWTWTYKRRTTKQQLVDGWVDVPKNAHNNFCYSIFFLCSFAIHRLVGLLPCINAPHDGKYTPKKKRYNKIPEAIFFRLVSHGRRISFRIHDRSGFLVTEGNCDETKNDSHVFFTADERKRTEFKMCQSKKCSSSMCAAFALLFSWGRTKIATHCWPLCLSGFFFNAIVLHFPSI